MDLAATDDLRVDTAVTRNDDGTFTALVRDGYGSETRVPNGGLLLTYASRGMAMVLSRPSVLTVTGHFLRPTTPGPASIAVDVLREGRLSTARAELRQNDELTMHATGVFVDRSNLGGPTRIDLTPPDLPPPEQCLSVRELVGGTTLPSVPVWFRLDHRIPAHHVGFARGDPSDHAEVAGWFRTLRGSADEMAVPFLMDAVFPSLFTVGIPIAFLPTLELTVQVRQPPPDDWMQYRFRTRAISGGVMEEDGELWTAGGQLIGLSRQTALPPR